MKITSVDQFQHCWIAHALVPIEDFPRVRESLWGLGCDSDWRLVTPNSGRSYSGKIKIPNQKHWRRSSCSTVTPAGTCLMHDITMRDSIVVRSIRRNKAGFHYARVFLQERQEQPLRDWCSQHGVLVMDGEGSDFRMRNWGCAVFHLIFPTPQHLMLFKLSWDYRMDDERSAF